MTYHIVYHWWRDNPAIKPYQDLTNPLILSIAALRAKNPDVPISVLDVSTVVRPLQDWGGFPKALNFEVVKWEPLLNQKLPRSSRLSSRIWDVWEYAKMVPEYNILFNDADIFWVKDPFPLECEDRGRLDELYCRANTGVWYFDRRSKRAEKAFEVWQGIISLAIVDKSFHDKCLARFTSGDGCPFQDEVAFGHLLTFHPDLYHPFDMWENLSVDALRSVPDLYKTKCVHALAAVLGQWRGRLCLILKELKEAITSVLTEDQLKCIFGDVKFDRSVEIEEVRYISFEHLKEILKFTGQTEDRITEILEQESEHKQLLL